MTGPFAISPELQNLIVQAFAEILSTTNRVEELESKDAALKFCKERVDAWAKLLAVMPNL